MALIIALTGCGNGEDSNRSQRLEEQLAELNADLNQLHEEHEELVQQVEFMDMTVSCIGGGVTFSVLPYLREAFPPLDPQRDYCAWPAGVASNDPQRLTHDA